MQSIDIEIGLDIWSYNCTLKSKTQVELVCGLTDVDKKRPELSSNMLQDVDSNKEWII